MKFDCPQKDLFEAISAASAAVSTRSTQPILMNVKIEADGSNVRIIGCDGELWVERNVPCLVTEPGAICLQARLITELIGKLGEGDVSFFTLASGAMIQQGQSEYRLQTLDAADFPDPPPFGGESNLTIPMGLLKSAVDSVSFAVSADGHRQTLTGVLFNYNGETLTLVATDTHRLAVRRIHQTGLGSGINAVLPEKALKAIKGMPVADDAEVKIEFGLQRLGVDAGGARVVAQLLAGTFPNWERVVPSEYTRVWTVEVDNLKSKLGRVLVIARDNASRVRFRGEEDQLMLAAHSDEKGDAKEQVQIVGTNPDVEIAFNGQYVGEALTPIKSAGVSVQLTESSRPAVFRPTDEEIDYFCVIMPMALA